VQRLIVQALRDPDPAVLEVAIGLAGAAKIKLATPTLLRLAAQRVLTGKSFGLRKAALAALGSMGDPGAVPTLRGALYTRTWFNRAAGDELRQAAALALLAMGRPQARELVVTGSASRRGDVRRACTAALKAAPDKK
jgi:HEAT repeat protein